ncbi:MAG: hypothetical protein KH704_01530 [Clostridiales bacterium]|nr:hypothetical protein [Clostridiales bacterium]
MKRKNIYEIMHLGEISLKKEYGRLYALIHDDRLEIYEEQTITTSIYSLAESFIRYFDLSFTNRAISLKEIQKAFGYTFTFSPKVITMEFMVAFCEFISNICYQLKQLFSDKQIDKEYIMVVERNTNDCMSTLGYSKLEYNGVLIYAEESSASLAVAEIIDDALSYKVLEYNHYRMRGNLVEKLGILKLMADDIDAKNIRSALHEINATLEKQLYQLINKFVRHNQAQTPAIYEMNDEELEFWYDNIYQMWLLAKLELEHVGRKKRIAELLVKING